MSEYISLHMLPRELKEIAGPAAPGYQRLYRLTVDGNLPATRTKTGRWLIDRAHIPAIMEVLGLTAKVASND